MLAEEIERLERSSAIFNRYEMERDQVLKWVRDLGILAYSSSRVESSSAFLLHGKPIILYNPKLGGREFVFAVGHEVGHHVLGHITGPLPFRLQVRKSCYRQSYEGQASIIGACCVIPRTLLDRLRHSGRLDIGSTYWHLTPWDAGSSPLAWEICRTRLEAYLKYLRWRRKKK